MRHILIILFLFGFHGLKAQEYSYHYVDEIKQLRKDTHGFIYLVSNQSVCKFDGEEVHSTCLYLESQISDAAILSEEKYFIATGDTFLVYENQIQTHKFPLNEIITCLEIVGSHVLIGTSGSGMYSYSIKTNNLSSLDIKGFINDIIGLDNAIYIITDTNIQKLGKNFERILSVKLPELLPKQIVSYGEEQLAILMNDGKIFFLNTNLEISSVFTPKDFKPIEITGKKGLLFAIDRNNLKQWETDEFVLLKRGHFKKLTQAQSLLFTANKNTIESYNVMSEFYNIEKTYSLCSDNDFVWLGREGKISLFDKGLIIKEIDFPVKYKRTNASSLVKYKNKIYAGTMGMGILVFDTSLNKFLSAFQKMNSNANEQNIIKLQVVDQFLWVGYLNGLKVFDLNTRNLVYDFTDLLKYNYLYSFHARGPDEFYLGTSDNGFIHVKNGKPEYYFRDQSVYTILDTPKGIIFSVEDKGVFVLNSNTVTALSNQYFLRSNDIYNILYVDKNVLFAHEQGVDILDWENNRMSYVSDENLTEPHLNSNTVSGSNCFIGFDNGIFALRTRLLNEIHEDGLDLNPPLLFDKKIETSRNKFTYKENVWSFLFESVDYSSPNERYYKYRLNPLENEWKTTTQEKITYYNLPPGKYNFEISSGGHRNFIPAHLKSFGFIISKPFWMFAWFWLLMLLILFVTVFLLIKYREKQIIEKEQLKNVQIQFEYQRIKDQINPHFLFNSFNSLIGLVEENSQKAATVLEKLSAMFRTVLEYENTEIISLSEELEMARQYFEIHKIRYHDLISLKIQDIEHTDKKFVIPMTLQLLIENAIKHNIINKNSRLEITIAEDKDFLVFSNNLNKKNKKALSLGLGLENLIKRNDMILNKKLVVEHNDSFYNVKIPYIYE